MIKSKAEHGVVLIEYQSEEDLLLLTGDELAAEVQKVVRENAEDVHPEFIDFNGLENHRVLHVYSNCSGLRGGQCERVPSGEELGDQERLPSMESVQGDVRKAGLRAAERALAAGLGEGGE